MALPAGRSRGRLHHGPGGHPPILPPPLAPRSRSRTCVKRRGPRGTPAPRAVLLDFWATVHAGQQSLTELEVARATGPLGLAVWGGRDGAELRRVRPFVAAVAYLPIVLERAAGFSGPTGARGPHVSDRTSAPCRATAYRRARARSSRTRSRLCRGRDPYAAGRRVVPAWPRAASALVSSPTSPAVRPRRRRSPGTNLPSVQVGNSGLGRAIGRSLRRLNSRELNQAHVGVRFEPPQQRTDPVRGSPIVAEWSDGGRARPVETSTRSSPRLCTVVRTSRRGAGRGRHPLAIASPAKWCAMRSGRRPAARTGIQRHRECRRNRSAAERASRLLGANERRRVSAGRCERGTRRGYFALRACRRRRSGSGSWTGPLGRSG